MSPALQEEIHYWFCKLRQNHMAGEVIRPGGEATAIILQNAHYVLIKLLSK